MIIDNEKGADLDEAQNDPLFPHHFTPHARLRQFRSSEIRDERVYNQLGADLVEHLWARRQQFL